jgi:hypothetical protein
VIAQQTRTRVENPARWMKAAERAEHEGVRVYQLQGSGQWVATSGSQQGVAYELLVTGNVAHGCDCLAGLNSDPVCKHRAAFYLLIGALDLTPEPPPAAPTLTLDCPECYGCGVIYRRELERAGMLYPTCHACNGTGQVSAPAVCAECGGAGTRLVVVNWMTGETTLIPCPECAVGIDRSPTLTAVAA